MEAHVTYTKDTFQEVKVRVETDKKQTDKLKGKTKKITWQVKEHIDEWDIRAIASNIEQSKQNQAAKEIRPNPTQENDVKDEPPDKVSLKERLDDINAALEQIQQR